MAEIEEDLTPQEKTEATPLVNQVITSLGLAGHPDEARARAAIMLAVIAIRRAVKLVK